MSITPIYTVWCDNDPPCQCWSAEEQTRQLAWRYARNRGWQKIKRDGKTLHLCPAHRTRNPGKCINDDFSDRHTVQSQVPPGEWAPPPINHPLMRGTPDGRERV